MISNTLFSSPAPSMETTRPTPATDVHSLPPALMHALETVETEVWSDFFQAAPPDVIASCAIDLSTIESATVMAVGTLDILFFNRAVGLGLGLPASETALDRLQAHYDALGVPRFFVQVSPAAAPAALFDGLHRHGFRHYNNWVKLFRGVDVPPAVDTDLRVERVGPDHAATFAKLAAPAFDWPDAVQPWLAQLVGRPGWHHYLAVDGDVPAATAALYTTGKYAYFGPAATHPDYRRRGAQSALIAQRIRDARAFGCETLITETAEDHPDHPTPSYRNMRRFGFEVAYLRPNYICEPGLCPPGI